MPPTGNPDDFARAHEQLLADSTIQFDLARLVPAKPPAWLVALGHFLDGIAPFLKILFWGVVLLLVLAILYALVSWLQGRPFSWPWARRNGTEAEDEAWRPEEAPARALLSEADALAAAGDYAGAAHLLLQRSIADLDSNRPELVRPALTSRDLAGAPALPPGPRIAFGRIVVAVEKSLFGGHALGPEDWQDCRQSYEAFAFSPEWQR
jgi:hypothetical protein